MSEIKKIFWETNWGEIAGYILVTAFAYLTFVGICDAIIQGSLDKWFALSQSFFKSFADQIPVVESLSRQLIEHGYVQRVLIIEHMYGAALWVAFIGIAFILIGLLKGLLNSKAPEFVLVVSRADLVTSFLALLFMLIVAYLTYIDFIGEQKIFFEEDCYGRCISRHHYMTLPIWGGAIWISFIPIALSVSLYAFIFNIKKEIITIT